MARRVFARRPARASAAAASSSSRLRQGCCRRRLLGLVQTEEQSAEAAGDDRQPDGDDQRGLRRSAPGPLAGPHPGRHRSSLHRFACLKAFQIVGQGGGAERNAGGGPCADP